MYGLLAKIEDVLDRKALAWLATARSDLAADANMLPRLFPQLPRRLGRQAMGSGRVTESIPSSRPRELDLAAWRRCDVGALDLLARATDYDLAELYHHGDMEERLMATRCMAMLPLNDVTDELLNEVQRSNTQSHFEAAILDSNLLVSALSEPNCPFGQADFNRMIVKVAFCDLPLERVYDATQGADADLSCMLQDLASEREAAGRGVWAGTCLMIAHAPIEGSMARILGGIEHGDDRQRKSAILGLIEIARPEHSTYASERIQHEPRPELRKLLEQLI